MEHERIWTLLSRKLTNEAIDAEVAELDILLNRYPEFIPAVQKVVQNWEDELPADPEFMEATYLIHLERMKKKGLFLSDSENENPNSFIKDTTDIKKKKKSFAYLVVICSLIGLTLAYIYPGLFVKHSLLSSNETVSNTSKNEIVTKNGTRTKTQLPDGSIVWLNSGSKVTYDGNLSGPKREVYLEGEAYFDVAKKPNRPFIVHTGNINIRVLGTAFNVKSYASDKTIETTLLRGLIEITNQNDPNSKAFFLHPNQKITIIKSKVAITGLNSSGISLSENPYIVSKIVLSGQKELTETAWMFNRLSFEGDDFEKLAQKLERWYDVKVIFEDDAVKKLRFNGSLENETVDQAFEALRMANPFNYKIVDHEIYVGSIPD